MSGGACKYVWSNMDRTDPRAWLGQSGRDNLVGTIWLGQTDRLVRSSPELVGYAVAELQWWYETRMDMAV